MKIISIVVVIFLGILNAGFSEFVKEVDNPNGEPFMVSLGIEKNLHSYRFDHIAAGLQKFTEKIVKQWFENLCKKFKASAVGLYIDLPFFNLPTGSSPQ